MTRFLQINLNRCWVAQAQMAQAANDLGTDVIIASEQNNTPQNGRWHADTTGSAAVVTLGRTPVDELGDAGPGYAWVRIGGVRVYSCYASPNGTWAAYCNFLSRLEVSIRGGTGEILLAGDFNAKNVGWGSSWGSSLG